LNGIGLKLLRKENFNPLKKLILIRHANSSFTQAGMSDFDRPLNQRGKNDVSQMAERILFSKLTIDQIVSSPALRAISKAETFSEVLDIPFENILQNKDIYEADSGMLMRIISEFESSWNNVIMFGHNLGLSYFVGLLTGELYNKGTCSISEIGIHSNDWAHCTAGIGFLISYDFPMNSKP
jgi:phosphohistidine phosphatase